jgi:hypothetical protein
MTIKDLITLEKLHLLYDKADISKLVVVNSHCSQCGIHLQVELHRTSEGFGMNRGVLFATRDGQLLAKCMKCYQYTKKENIKRQAERQPVYSTAAEMVSVRQMSTRPISVIIELNGIKPIP